MCKVLVCSGWQFLVLLNLCCRFIIVECYNTKCAPCLISMESWRETHLGFVQRFTGIFSCACLSGVTREILADNKKIDSGLEVKSKSDKLFPFRNET